MIDLRSDTMTLPTLAMKQAMIEAELGDDVWGEDPSCIAFQEQAAERFGKEAALLLPCATQANLIAILCNCQRGEEYITGDEFHCYRWEAGGAAVLGSVQPQTIEAEEDGTLDLDKVESKIKPDDPHHTISRLVCLENTTHGRVIPIDYLAAMKQLCDKHGLQLHLDGARIFNAAVAMGKAVKELVQYFDTITLCLSKGLGCPMGALLFGTKDCIKRAVRWRKMLGGGLRQAGMIAAAGQYAFAHHVERLADDHRNAEIIAQGLRDLESGDIQVLRQSTNMVFVKIADQLVGSLQEKAKEKGLLLPKGKHLRLVTHLDVNEEGAHKAVEIISKVCSQ